MTQLEKLQGLLDGLVAAGSPGAAAWLQDEYGSLQAASGLANLDTPASRCGPTCVSVPAA